MRYVNSFFAQVVLAFLAQAIGWTGVPSELIAQGDPAQRSIACFEEAVKARLSGGDTLCAEGVTPPLDIVMTPDDHPDDLVEDVLDGLAEMAIISDNRIVRSEAVAWLAFPGLVGRGTEPRSGIVARLVKVYRESGDRLPPEIAYHNRSHVVALVGKQAERTEAAAFLEQVARVHSDPGSSERQLSAEAVWALRGVGEPGKAALQRLGESKKHE